MYCSMQRALTILIASALPIGGAAEILFEDVSTAAGLTYSGPSFGSSWGDFNGDGRPDLWIGHHAFPPGLYVNQPSGVFDDRSADIGGAINSDQHGAAWADVDNDGDDDLVAVVGSDTGQGIGRNKLYINDAGARLLELALPAGLTYAEGRGRSPLWLDLDDDADLDLYFANWDRADALAPSALFENVAGTFTNVTATDPTFSQGDNDYGQLVSLDGGDPLLMVHYRASFPAHAYDYSGDQLVDVKDQLGLPVTSNVRDSVFADFDGDGLTDLLLIRASDPPTVVQRSPAEVAAVLAAPATAQGVTFLSDGDVQLPLEVNGSLAPGDVYLGAGQTNPASTYLVLSAADPSFDGEPAFTPGVDSGVFIWRDTATDRWHISLSNRGGLSFIATSSTTIDDVQTVGFTASDGAAPDRLFIANGNGFDEVSGEAGLSEPTACVSGAAADFDNDTDLDVYLVCRNTAGNLPNLVLENLGDGSFQRLVAGGDLPGTDLGRGESVTLADYDLDGRVDVLLTNGAGAPPFNNGPDQLLRNVSTGSNHWIQVDLVGQTSNRSGIGARVTVVAGGKTQRRLADGGMHRVSQNHGRLHYGLGTSTVVDELRVDWPSGLVQQLTGIAADQIVTVTEPAPPPVDTDSDGVFDDVDNCTDAANPGQEDSDADGYGNLCDADFDNNCGVSFSDLAFLKERFLTGDPVADMNSDGSVNFGDLALFKTQFFGQPGPSGVGTCD